MTKMEIKCYKTVLAFGAGATIT